MAFNDDPVVDANSERSEESVLQVKLIFNRKSGFICRDETPDYGVDINIELITEHGATSKIFPVQVKSDETVEIITYQQEQYVSVRFKTSRLGYLCRRPPTYGIITIYDEKNKVTYFDYVESIVNRLTEHRDDEYWKLQDEVQIRIPLNVLNEVSSINIHKMMSRRFASHDSLLDAYGHMYRIPTFKNKTANKPTDFNNPNEIEQFLKESGLHLFNSKSFDMIVGLLGRLSNPIITKSKELTLLAAITYGQVGMTMESEYHLKSSTRFPQAYDEDERFMLDYTRLMVTFKKGEIDHTKFYGALQEIKLRSKNAVNNLTIDINLIYSKFTDGSVVDENILVAIYEVLAKIEEASIAGRDRNILKLLNLENLHNYGTGLYLKDGSRFKLQQKMGLRVPMSDRLKRVNAIARILNDATDQTHAILKGAIEENDQLVIAYASYYEARFFFMKNFQTMMLDPVEARKSSFAESDLFENNLNFCYHAVTLFFELSMFHEAHQSLSCALDILNLYWVLFDKGIGPKTLVEVTTDLRNLELTSGLQHYESIVESSYKSLRSESTQVSRPWSPVPDDKVQQYAQIVLDAYGIPQDRLVNIVSDIKAYKTFEQQCSNPDLVLLQDLSHLRSLSTTYSDPPVYVIKSTKTGIKSKRSTNVNELLDLYGDLIKKKT